MAAWSELKVFLRPEDSSLRLWPLSSSGGGHYQTKVAIDKVGSIEYSGTRRFFVALKAYRKRTRTMKFRFPVWTSLLALGIGLAATGLASRAASAEEGLQETIDHLVEYVRTSEVVFIRNNKEHSPEDAAEHILKKYEHYRKKIKTPEDFIRLCATKSMISGKAYRIRTPEGEEMATADWLTRELEAYRRSKDAPSAAGSAPGTTASERDGPVINAESPDSSRYETRSFERKYGDCDDPRTDCAVVKVRYPEMTTTPFVGTEHDLNAVIMEAALRMPAEEAPAGNLDELASGFFLDYRNLKQDMPDYSTGWFLERRITVMHNSAQILSLGFSDILFTGGAHPNSTTRYASVDVSTGTMVSLEDILVAGYEKPLNDAGEAAFRNLKGIPPKQRLDDAGFWFEEGKFRLNENFAIIREGLVFYFNSYEIASYADGPTRLVIPAEALRPLIRKDRMEWLSIEG